MNILNQALKVISGNIVKTLFGILAMPIISRIYLPNSFGVATYFASIISVLLIFCSLKYPKAIMLPKENKERHSLVLGTAYVTCVNILIVSTGVFFLGNIYY